METNSIIFSIIIPVFKAENYLSQCLDSVLKQTFTNWECILVDDGSPDNSGIICDKYAKKDSRFLVVHKENGGVSSARNAALNMVKGQYVGFLDADDLLATKVLERVNRSFEINDVDWVRIRHTNFRNQEISNSVTEDGCIVRYVPCEKVLKEGCSILQKVTFPVLNFFRLSLIGNTRFPLGIRFREDAIFLYEMVTKSKGLAIDTYPGYLRRQVDGSATFSPRHSDDSYKLYEAFIEMQERTKAEFPDLSQWFYKDITQWLGGCPEIIPEDNRNTLQKLRQIYKLGLINLLTSKEKKIALRLILYIKTGCKSFLFVSLRNPLGRVRKYKTSLS